jgi:hypothetical protein
MKNAFPFLLTRTAHRLVLALWLVALSQSHAQNHHIQPFEANRYYWQFRGEPILLLGGSDDDNLFQWETAALRAQLDSLQAAGGNYVRNTMSSRDEGNLQPFARGADGKYDLDQWNPEYWERLEQFLRMTAERDIFVQIEFWDPWDTYAGMWARNPWNPANNVNDTPSDTRLETAYASPQYRDGTSFGRPHDFFLTPPSLQNDRTLLARQQRFVEQVLARSLPYGHVLYCVSNEIHPQYPPQWGWYWAEFIREKAAAAGRSVFVTEMYWTFDFQADQHRASFDRPDLYGYFEASQNSATRLAEAHWHNLQFARRRLADHPRPINHTKTYGADSGPVWAGKDRDALERFWRNLIGGAASIRFHRPPAGLGLSETSQTHLKSARLLAGEFDFFQATPDASHRLLGDRAANEAYLSSVGSEQFAIYFPDGGSVSLDVRETAGRFMLRWLDVEAARWTGSRTVGGGAQLELQTPGRGHWVALLTRAQEKARPQEKNRIRPWPDNPHWLAWGDTPVFPLGATDHHAWTPISRPEEVDFEARLDRLARVMEQIGSPNVCGFVRCLPYDPMNHLHDGPVKKVLQPWVMLEDGRYDLERFEPAWEARLRAFLSAALQRRIVVSLEIWDDWSVTRGPGGQYDPGAGAAWNAHPFNPLNNINYDAAVFPVRTSVCDAPFYSTIPSRNNIEPVLELQQRYVDRVLAIAVEYPNVWINISNESRAHLEWSRFWAKYIRERIPAEMMLSEMPSTNRRDGGGECEHPLSPLTLSTDERYDMVDIAQGVSGHEFRNPRDQALSGSRRILACREAMIAAGNPKPLIVSKDYTRGPEGGDIVLWSRFVGGAAATRFHRPAGNHPPAISQFQHDAVGRLGQFIARVPFWEMRPAPEIIRELPDGGGANVLAEAGGHVVVQLIGGEAGASLGLTLPAGEWAMKWIDPATGRELSRAERTSSAAGLVVELPAGPEHRILHVTPRQSGGL